MKKSKIISITFGLLASVGIIFAINYYCKLQLVSHGIKYQHSSEAYKNHLIQFRVPDVVLSNLKADPNPTTLNIKYAGLDLSKKGQQFLSGTHYRSIVKIKDSGEILYDVQFHLDENKRRIVERPPSIKNNTAILFIGCSFTYGEGVNDLETFASLISKNIVGTNVYNLGVGGSTESEIFYKMNNSLTDFYMALKEKNIIIVNTFFDAHLVRQACDLSCYGRNQWILEKPKYILDSENKIQFKGFFRDYFSINYITDTIFKSSFFTYFNFQSANTISDQNLNLTAEIMDQIKSKYSKNHKVVDFYNYFHEYSSNDIINRLSEKLLKKGIKPILPNKKYIYENFGKKAYIPVDSHPNALGHQIMANSILWSLQKDHPILFAEKLN